ncbi:hypothetical protein [Plesiomonas sp.]|uniref:hypothetical protein n=1 Tax=Plesiomonas sp. TaxID=2486279 RepID=UPI003F35EEFC
MLTVSELSTCATIIAAISAFMLAVAAFKANSTAKSAIEFQIRLEKNKLNLLKHQESLKLLQSIISSFARIEAIATSGWAGEHKEQIDNIISKLKSDINILKAIDSNVSEQIRIWEHSKTENNESIPQVIYYAIGSMYGIIGNKYDVFLS